jgi:hypothetical protein
VIVGVDNYDDEQLMYLEYMILVSLVPGADATGNES